MEMTIPTYVETLVVLLIVGFAVYSLMRRGFAPKAQQKACGSGSCSACSMNQSVPRRSQPSALVASPKQRTIAIVPMPEQSKGQ